MTLAVGDFVLLRNERPYQVVNVSGGVEALVAHLFCMVSEWEDVDIDADAPPIVFTPLDEEEDPDPDYGSGMIVESNLDGKQYYIQFPFRASGGQQRYFILQSYGDIPKCMFSPKELLKPYQKSAF